MRALSDQQEKVIVSQRMLEIDNQLATLTASRWVLYDVVLGAGQGSAQLSPRLNKARLQVDSLISKGSSGCLRRLNIGWLTLWWCRL